MNFPIARTIWGDFAMRARNGSRPHESFGIQPMAGVRVMIPQAQVFHDIALLLSLATRIGAERVNFTFFA